jgi:hypothetical protein
MWTLERIKSTKRIGVRTLQSLVDLTKEEDNKKMAEWIYANKGTGDGQHRRSAGTDKDQGPFGRLFVRNPRVAGTFLRRWRPVHLSPG